MSLYALKPRFQSLLHPVAVAMHRLGLSANQVTASTCVVSIAVGAWLTLNSDELVWFLLLPVWCFARMALNAIDGMIAREFKQTSALGAYLNELGDVIADAALYCPLAFVPGVSPIAVILVLFLAALSEFAGVLGYAVGAKRCQLGPMGKSDRALVFGALGLLVGLEVSPGTWLNVALGAIGILLTITIIRRVTSGMQTASSQSSK